MELKLNGLNLNSGFYLTEEIVFDSSPPIEFSDFSFASEDGAKFISSRYTPKTLTIRGRITQSTVALLEHEMDFFKKTILSDPNINLNFSYAGGYRQYVGNIANLTMTRKHFQLTYVPFEITFVAGDPPFSYDISTIDSVTPTMLEAFSGDGISSNTYSHTLSFTGTAPPLAKWTYFLDAVSGTIAQIIFKSKKTGEQMEINQAMAAGDEIIIEEKDLSVKYNCTPMTYEGVFPSFKLGANELEVSIYGSSTSEQSGYILDQFNLAVTSIYDLDYKYNIAQTFTAGVGRPLRRASLMLFKDTKWNDTPNKKLAMSVSLWSTSGGAPLAKLADSTTSFTFDDIPYNKFVWENFEFDYTMVSGTVYAIVLDYPNPVQGAYFCHSGNVYSGGGAWGQYLKVGSWIDFAIYDLTFKTYYSLTSASTTFDHEASLKVEYEKRFL